MSLRDSESDLGGRLGALTPQLRGARMRESVENSGLVDMRALYAASVEQVMQRAQVARARPPVVAFDPLVPFDPVAVDEEPIVLPRRRLGWLPITVLLVAVATAGSLFVANSNVPAVMHAKATLAPAVVRANAAIVDIAMRTEAAVVARVDQLMGRTVAVAVPASIHPPEAPPVIPPPLPVVIASAPPVGEVAPLTAVVDAKPAPPLATPARASVTAGHALPKAATDVRSTTHAPKHPASANLPMKAAAPAKAPAAEQAPAEPVKAQAPAAVAADSKPMSLDDMIRRSVEADSKRKP
jgi:hypothetical protein